MRRRGSGMGLPAVSGTSWQVTGEALQRTFTAGTYGNVVASIVAWVRPANTAKPANNPVIMLGTQASTSVHCRALSMGSVGYIAVSGGSSTSSFQPAEYGTWRTQANQRNGWDLVAAVFAASNSRRLWMNGRWMGESTTNRTGINSPDCLSMFGSTGTVPAANQITLLWPAVWEGTGGALDAADLEALYNGACPLDIRPANLISFVPDWSTRRDIVAAADFVSTAGGRFNAGLYAPPSCILTPAPKLYFPVGGFGAATYVFNPLSGRGGAAAQPLVS